MCGPAAFMVASAVMSAYGSIQQGKQQQAAAEYQAEQAEADAKASRSAAQTQAEKIRKAARLQQGEARTSLAGSGVDVNDNGTADIINSSIRDNADDDALQVLIDGYDRSNRLNSQAEGYRISGKNARNSSYLSAAGSALQAGSSMSQGWKTASNRG